ncbi:cytochrome P450 CYP749A22-like [Olea europaea subsp. europaea]|uniref:Cytochrome P450 CYP749A22-like n=1 Tax=Olea europaea subsp. europaea TaxID=158383 RepID=A0A8S0RTF5_OLEEU|nr:cytochrome P450 CYP749A22-like [Olea europaea subsp. europaea]
MAVLSNIVVLVAFSFLICILFILSKLLNKVWLNPIRIQYMMKLQGIKGPSYKFLYGNTAEIINMRKESMGKAMSNMDHNILPRILPHVHTWVNIYGSNFLYWIGPQAQLVVTEPELIKEVLNNKDGNYPKIDLEGFAKKLLGDGLSSSKGEKWANMRKVANHAFHAESLRNMVPAMISSVEMMLEKWKEHEGNEIEVFEEFRVLTSEVISKTAFGSSYLEGKNIFDMLMKLTVLVSRNVHKIKFPGISRFMKSSDEIESEKLEQGIRDCIVKIIAQREQHRNERDESFRSDFLGKLLQANEETDRYKRMSIEAIVDECKTFYFAGHETTTSLLAWTVLLLATNEEWQDSARQEVTGLFGQTNPNPDAIARLKIINMIIEESLRLYPPVPAIKRKVFKEVQLGNLTLPSYTELYISPLALHHDPKIWGEDVHLFRPERFSEGIVKATKNNTVAFLPFGFGPRTCEKDKVSVNNFVKVTP